MVQKIRESYVKQKCYINRFENLSVLNMYFIKAFIILLSSLRL